MPAYPEQSWLDPRVQVQRSTIEGTGLFALAPIPAGDVVMRLGGTPITDRQLAELQPHSSLAIGEGLNLMQDDDDPAQFGNHSCDPNLWLHDAVTVVARRDIAAGEELTIDYGLMTVATWQMTCRCGASGCRGIITGDDWTRPDLQERYRGHFSPFINARIRALEQE